MAITDDVAGTAPGLLDRVCSAFTLLVKPVVAGIFPPGKYLLVEESGQLPNLG